MTAWLAALLAVLTALVAAPLVLVTHAALEDSSRLTAQLWLGFLVLLCLATLGAGGLALLLSVR